MDNNVYQEIIDGLTTDKIKQLLYDLGALDIKDTPSALITQTICHNINAAEASMKLYYYKDNHFFYCYTEDGPQSVFKLIEHIYQTRGIEYDWYNDVFLLVTKGKQQEELKPPKIELLKDRYERKIRESNLEVYSSGILEVFEKIYPTPQSAENIDGMYSRCKRDIVEQGEWNNFHRGFNYETDRDSMAFDSSLGAIINAIPEEAINQELNQEVNRGFTDMEK